MDTKCKGSGHCHNRDRDRCTIHIDRCTERDSYRVSISVKSHFLADFHVYRNVGGRTSGEKCSQRASLQAMEDQWIRILADAPVNEHRVGNKIDKQHTANQQKKQFTVSSKDIQSVCRYCVEHETEDTKWCHVDDPGNNCGKSVCNISKNVLGHVVGST